MATKKTADLSGLVATKGQAAPVAKPSLAAQFANALATLHVTGERRS